MTSNLLHADNALPEAFAILSEWTCNSKQRTRKLSNNLIMSNGR